MKYRCPSCEAPVRSLKAPACLRCGCELGILNQIIVSAKDSLGLAMLALREGRDRDAHEFACESWGLRRSRAASAAGLIAATMMRDPIEISRWIRRRERLDQAGSTPLPV
jgi:hypothetical protein